MEQKIVLSSEVVRRNNNNNNNQNTPSEFTVRFSRPLVLDKNKRYIVGLDSINSMTYSWHNISDEYDNKRIRYNNGKEWKDIFFTNGSYSYTDINNYIRETLISNNDFDGASAIAPISLEFDLSSFKILISLMDNFSLDFTLSEFCKLLGFKKKKVNKTEWGSLTPNITNSVDTIYIHCDLIDNSLVDGEFGDVIYALSTADLTRAYPFTKEPIRVGYSEINRNIINSIRIYITDVFGRKINFNEVETSFTLIIKEM
jgi:hypothetical protein